MTVLAEFECPNCGAKVDRPKPGQTLECPYCAAELSEPEPPPPVVVREIVRERVIERVKPAAPVPDFRRSTVSVRTRVAVLLGLVAVAVVFVVMLAASSQQGIDRTAAQDRSRDNCERACNQRCEKRYQAALPEKRDGAPGAGLGIAEYEQQQNDDRMAGIRAQSEKTICDSDCTQTCR